MNKLLHLGSDITLIKGRIILWPVSLLRKLLTFNIRYKVYGAINCFFR